jgi:hypothetical protein
LTRQISAVSTPAHDFRPVSQHHSTPTKSAFSQTWICPRRTEKITGKNVTASSVANAARATPRQRAPGSLPSVAPPSRMPSLMMRGSTRQKTPSANREIAFSGVRRPKRSGTSWRTMGSGSSDVRGYWNLRRSRKNTAEYTGVPSPLRRWHSARSMTLHESPGVNMYGKRDTIRAWRKFIESGASRSASAFTPITCTSPTTSNGQSACQMPSRAAMADAGAE